MISTFDQLENLRKISMFHFQMLRTLLLRSHSTHHTGSQYALLLTSYPSKRLPPSCILPSMRCISSGRNVLPTLASRGLLQVICNKCARVPGGIDPFLLEGYLAPRRPIIPSVSLYSGEGGGAINSIPFQSDPLIG